MTKLILLAIVALGTIAGLALWILKRWWGKPQEISNLKEEADEITANMAAILDYNPTDWRAYRKLAKRLWVINRKVARISAT